MSAPRRSRLPAWLALSRLDAHHRQIIALTAGIGAFFFLPSHDPSLLAHLISSWAVFAGTLIVLCWIVMLRRHPSSYSRLVTLQDTGRTFLFTFVLAAACMSVLAVFFAIEEQHHVIKEAAKFQLLIQSIFSVAESWILVHTLFTLRYAHLYYRPEPGSKEPGGGLEFPSTPSPDYLDFAYFAFIIGMTCQTSDTGVSSRPMRRLALLHGLIAFIFNTAIVALSINMLASLL